MVAQAYGDDREGLQAHFDWLTREELDQALAYAARFPDEIEERLRANEECGERLRREFELRGTVSPADLQARAGQHRRLSDQAYSIFRSSGSSDFWMPMAARVPS